MAESIQGIIDAIAAVESRILIHQPEATELRLLTLQVDLAARRAERRIRGMRSAWSLPRVRMYVLIVTIIMALLAVYHEHFASETVSVAVQATALDLLGDRTRRSGIKTLRLVEVSGSTTALTDLRSALVDAAVVQGGVELLEEKDSRPRFFERLGQVHQEHLLYLRRPMSTETRPIERVITFSAGEGSEQVARRFYQQWGKPVTFLNHWGRLCAGEPLNLTEVDAMFVIVDMAQRRMQACLRRAYNAGFRLVSPSVGAYESHLEYLTYSSIRRGYFNGEPPIPEQAVDTYLVADYLFARPGLTTQQRTDLVKALSQDGHDGDDPTSAAQHRDNPVAATEVVPFLLEHSPDALPAYLFELLGRLSHSEGNALTADLANIFEAIVNLALIVAALFGLEVILHRRYIQELSTLLTHISQLQADYDVVGVADGEKRRQNMLFLEACSDLLGLISSIAGYYSHGNAALAFNGLTGFVHVRANLLKLNIQLKLVQAVQLAAVPPRDDRQA